MEKFKGDYKFMNEAELLGEIYDMDYPKEVTKFIPVNRIITRKEVFIPKEDKKTESIVDLCIKAFKLQYRYILYNNIVHKIQVESGNLGDIRMKPICTLDELPLP